MVAAKKIKKTYVSINNRLALVMKSGKFTLAYKTVLKTIRNSKGKFTLISNNCPPLKKIQNRVLCHARQNWCSPLQWNLSQVPKHALHNPFKAPERVLIYFLS
ncbi:hypothetical protein ACS0TY_024569 [Phlomoides rotata]